MLHGTTKLLQICSCFVVTSLQCLCGNLTPGMFCAPDPPQGFFCEFRAKKSSGLIEPINPWVVSLALYLLSHAVSLKDVLYFQCIIIKV